MSSEESSLERELGNAHQAFMRAMSTGSHRGIRQTGTGHNFWDIVNQYSHPELEDMISYLKRNEQKLGPQELVQAHLEIVRYFGRISHLVVPGVELLNEHELQTILTLYIKRGQQQELERRITDAGNSVRQTAETRAKMGGLFQILYEHLHTDKQSLVSPQQRAALMEDSSIKLEAFREYLRETGQLSQTIEEHPLSLVSLSQPQQPPRNVLMGMDLRDKVKAYLVAGYLLTYLDRQAAATNAKIGEVRTEREQSKLKPQEIGTLQLFERDSHAMYSTSNYFALYTNAVWSQVLHFFTELKKKGIPVNVNVNI